MTQPLEALRKPLVHLGTLVPQTTRPDQIVILCDQPVGPDTAWNDCECCITCPDCLTALHPSNRCFSCSIAKPVTDGLCQLCHDSFLQWLCDQERDRRYARMANGGN